eukprot:CAMPEP_0184696018 /NCGR_PEP_ID=MMETSP0313-20130426/3454_1 /TAXON_ID=2792 /ORGANISM="Porphyridium aerugineum, Strain SAG 1380-2" /LENGTH=372 /DNA_ID=CAMNT_0027154567 /DNA_START=95 /DNA_END=1209 /DNA_ORIENTATION=-
MRRPRVTTAPSLTRRLPMTTQGLLKFSVLYVIILIGGSVGLYFLGYHVGSWRHKSLLVHEAALHKKSQMELESFSTATGGEGGEGATPAKKPLRFAIISAHVGSKYGVMASLAAETKSHYARLYGYSFFSDHDLLDEKMSFQQKSGIRIAAFRRHMDDHDWLMWLDTDVLIVNANKSLDTIVNSYAPEGSGKFVIISKDWGGRQVNPGVTLLSTSKEGRAFVDQWENEINLVHSHDDLLAIRDGMEKNNDPELEYVRWVRQNVLNSYAQVELLHQPFNSTTVEHHESHDLWKPGDQFVHVVNCLRQYHRLDSVCCDGIASYYYYQFFQSLRAVLAADSSLRAGYESRYSANPDNLTPETWYKPYYAQLCQEP